MTNTTMIYKINAFHLKQVVDVMKELLTEATFTFKKSSIEVTALDADKVCCISMCMSEFVELQTADKEEHIGIYVPHLYKILRGAKKGSILTIKVDTEQHTITLGAIDDTSNCSITLESVKVSPYNHTLIKGEIMPIQVEVMTSRLSAIVGSLSMLSNIIDVDITNTDELLFKARGNIGNGEYSVYGDNVNWLRRDKEIQSRFYTKFIDKFCKPSLSPTVFVSMDKNQPLILGYPYTDGGIMLQMFLMPLPTD